MRLIDADAVMRNNLFTERDRGFLLDAPTIDAVEVVRCKDCAHYNGGEVEDGYDKCWYHWTAVEANDYCSYGVRGEDGEA